MADAIAAAAGTDASPELVLSNVVSPVLQLQPRPPLAVSGYEPGTIGDNEAQIALNISHIGIFGSGAGGAIVRVNWVMIQNNSGGDLNYELRRVDAPFTGVPSVRAVPGYINAGNPTTGRVFLVMKNDTVAAIGVSLGAIFRVVNTQTLFIPGPWILNDGALMVTPTTVNQPVRAQFGYESWPAIRVQPAG